MIIDPLLFLSLSTTVDLWTKNKQTKPNVILLGKTYGLSGTRADFSTTLRVDRLSQCVGFWMLAYLIRVWGLIHNTACM